MNSLEPDAAVRRAVQRFSKCQQSCSAASARRPYCARRRHRPAADLKADGRLRRSSRGHGLRGVVRGHPARPALTAGAQRRH